VAWLETNAEAVAELLGLAYDGPDRRLTNPAPTWDAGAGSLTFLSGPIAADTFADPGPGLVIAAPPLLEELKRRGIPAIGHDAPKFAFCKAATVLMRPPMPTGIHDTAVVGSGVQVGAQVYIGPFCHLEGDIVLEDGVYLESHISLHNKVAVGRNSIIRAGCRIGYDPFSFGRSADGEAYSFPAYGGVVIGEFVEVFHNANIARGAAGDTVIEPWCRVGNAAHIGNTVHIGQGSTVCAQTDISARTAIGERCWIAQSAAIRQNITIGDGVTVGMGAVVVADVPSDTTVIGVPARAMGNSKLT
jgi:UDP-3-O-[3-hydroxymyristoyl] glucosamine N-acyltransferase LpxD